MSDTAHTSLDKFILLEVAQGVERAMQDCVNKYGSLVWAIARRYVHNQTAVEDLVQEIFTDIWKSAKKFDPNIATESTFVGLLARRRAIDFIRKESRRPELEPIPEGEFLPEQSTESSNSMQFDTESVRAALSGLPDESQKIFTMHFEQGMTHAEIADATELPLGTIKTRLRRGLITLRDMLRNQENLNLSAS